MTEISVNYAQALYSLALEDASVEGILEQLETLQQVFADTPDFLKLLSNPGISKQERCRVLEECFREQVHPYVLNFLKILTEKGCAKAFSSCVKAYREQYCQNNGILTILAVSAVELTSDQNIRLQQKLEQLTGKTVKLQTRVDPSCLGGVRLDFDGKRIDGTVKTRLETFRSQLNNTVL